MKKTIRGWIFMAIEVFLIEKPQNVQNFEETYFMKME